MINPVLVRRWLLYLIPILAIVFNCLLSFFPRQSSLALVKGIVFLSITFLVFSGKPGFLLKNFKFIWVLIIFWLLLMFRSTNIERTLEYIIKIGLPISFFPLAYYYLGGGAQFFKLLNMLFVVLAIFVVFAFLSNSFGWGMNQYSGEGSGFRVGLYDAQLYSPAIVLVMIPLYIEVIKPRKIFRFFIVLLAVISLLLLVLSLRRTSVLIVFIGIVSYFYFQGKIKLIFIYFLVLTGLFILLSPLYMDILIERISYRGNIISSEYEVTEELRYREIFYVLEDLYKNFSIGNLFLGKELFNSPGHYGFTDGFLSERQLHVDYVQFFHGSGVIGLLLYLYFLFSIWRLFRRGYLNKNNGFLEVRIASLFKSMLILTLFISISGQMDELSFRSILFILMGSICGMSNNKNAFNTIA